MGQTKTWHHGLVARWWGEFNDLPLESLIDAAQVNAARAATFQLVRPEWVLESMAALEVAVRPLLRFTVPRTAPMTTYWDVAF